MPRARLIFFLHRLLSPPSPPSNPDTDSRLTTRRTFSPFDDRSWFLPFARNSENVDLFVSKHSHRETVREASEIRPTSSSNTVSQTKKKNRRKTIDNVRMFSNHPPRGVQPDRNHIWGKGVGLITRSFITGRGDDPRWLLLS